MTQIVTDKKPSKIALMRKLARSTNFVVITDKEAFMSVELADDMNSMLNYTTTRSSLESMKDLLEKTVTEMDKKMGKSLEAPGSGRNSKKSNKKVRS